MRVKLYNVFIPMSNILPVHRHRASSYREERGERLVQIKERERPGFEPSPPRSKVNALDRSATVGRLGAP